MIKPIFVLFFLFSTVGLVIGLWRKNVPTLSILSALWWLGAFVSAYFTFLAWMDRGYSENWAMMGFLYLALPYAAPVIVLLLIELYFLRRWNSRQARALQSSAIALLTFLVLQMIAGFMSA
ncbi:MAG: hypothetical protein AB1649_31765 [Chloroflexota bacterium]